MSNTPHRKPSSNHSSSHEHTQSRPDTNRGGSVDSARGHSAPGHSAPNPAAPEHTTSSPKTLRINGTEPHNQHAMFPDWAGDWSKNNVVDRRSGTVCRREGENVRRGTPPANGPNGPTSPDGAEQTAGDGSTATGDTSGLSSASRRRGAGRRLSNFGRCAEEGDFNPEQFMFVMAIDAFKRANGMTFPAWTDVLEIIRLLGYRKTCHSELDIRSAEDWTEKPDAKSNVRPDGWEKRAA